MAKTRNGAKLSVIARKVIDMITQKEKNRNSTCLRLCIVNKQSRYKIHFLIYTHVIYRSAFDCLQFLQHGLELSQSFLTFRTIDRQIFSQIGECSNHAHI